jgi:CRP/FNR family transcriptional regulator, cyclic AMP receptor protein
MEALLSPVRSQVPFAEASSVRRVRVRPSSTAPAPAFDAQGFLDSVTVTKQFREFREGEHIFRQGDVCAHVFYLASGLVKLSVLSTTGKEAVVAMLGSGDFFGEGCLAGQPHRTASATATETCTVLLLEKEAMMRLLHDNRAMSDQFIAHMLARNIRIEQDLVDQLFNSSEKRLARALLLLAGYGGSDRLLHRVPRLSQATLAEMIGTTRSRVNFFLNRFRRLGFIEYHGTSPMVVHNSLLTVVLRD